MRNLLLHFCILAMGLLYLSRPAVAHPHEFIDTGLGFRFDDKGLLGAISVVWTYDDLTSLLILEDLGMDKDGDGVLTAEEIAKLTEMAGNWPADFTGNLFVSAEGLPVGLSGPLEAKAGLQDGRLFMQYIRALPERVDPALKAITLQAYDPSYYTYYDLVGAPQVIGRVDCAAEVTDPDVTAAQKLYDAALAELTDEEMMEQGLFPEIGGAFAAKVRLTCSTKP